MLPKYGDSLKKIQINRKCEKNIGYYWYDQYIIYKIYLNYELQSVKKFHMNIKIKFDHFDKEEDRTAYLESLQPTPNYGAVSDGIRHDYVEKLFEECRDQPEEHFFVYFDAGDVSFAEGHKPNALLAEFKEKVSEAGVAGCGFIEKKGDVRT